MSAAASLVVAAALAGCGTTTYFEGRQLPPSGLKNRVLIAIQNPSSFTSGTLQFVDAYYDIRYKYNSTNTAPAFTIAGFSANLPISIQNMPEELSGGVYGSGDGSYTLVNYSTENASGGSVSGLNGLSSSVFMTRSESFVFAASQKSAVLTVVNRGGGSSYPLGLPGVYRVSVNPGGSMALAFVQNSNYAYYPRQLTSAQGVSFSGGPSTWPKAAVDCQPQSLPAWCLFQAQSPDNVDATGNYYGAPLVFDRPVKALFSADGGTAYVLNCGPECGGTTASISILPVAPLIFTLGQQSGLLPCNPTLPASPCSNTHTTPITNILIPGGASNALVDSSIMYVVGQKPQLVAGQTLFTGNLTVVNLANKAVSTSVSISDGAPGAVSRMIEADDNTLWIGMTKCTNGVRAATSQAYGCLTMVNIATPTSPTATLLPYIGDATGIAAVTGLHKVYTAENGQVYIYSTVNGQAFDNQYVTVQGTAYDVAYMDGINDTNNTVY
jgi:hypothetical protein